jgi:hypothetical protein
MSYYRTQGQIGHFTVRTDNPVEIIRIAKYSGFFRQRILETVDYQKILILR